MVGDETEGDLYAASSLPQKSSQFGQSKLFIDEAMSWVDRDDDSGDSSSSAGMEVKNIMNVIYPDSSSSFRTK